VDTERGEDELRAGMTPEIRVQLDAVEAIRALALLALLGAFAAGCGGVTKKVVVARVTSGGPLKRAGTVRPGLLALDRRIGPVSFGEAKPHVTKLLGRSVVARINGHLLRLYPGVGIYVDYAPNPPRGKPTIADFVITRSARYKTRSGIGVGSTIRQLRHLVKVRCYGGTAISAPDTCQHERTNINLPFTVFTIDPMTKRVTQVAIVPGGD
jgi:hypothetical protein